LSYVRLSIFCLFCSVVNHKAPQSKRELSRANKEHGDRITNSGLIGGAFTSTQNPAYQNSRAAVFDRLWTKFQESTASRTTPEISVTLPNGDVKKGNAFKTSPLDIALSISKGLADSVVIAKVYYSNRYEDDVIVACDEDDEASANKQAAAQNNAASIEDSPNNLALTKGELWDLNRPLIGDCHLALLKFDDAEAKTVFWHSSAHVLGAAIEAQIGAHLTIGPPLQSGFYYDSYMGDLSVPDEDLKKIENKAMELCKNKYEFQRLVVTKQEALEIFSANPFKVSLITNKVPDNAKTTVYRCGPFIDLCMGPHLPNTGRIKAFAAVKTSSTNWLGQVSTI
jgi:threonyl-tRNA synthetase